MEIAAGVHDTGAGLRKKNVPNASVPKSRMWTHKSGSVRGAAHESGPYSTRWWSTATPPERHHRKKIARRRCAVCPAPLPGRILADPQPVVSRFALYHRLSAAAPSARTWLGAASIGITSPVGWLERNGV